MKRALLPLLVMVIALAGAIAGLLFWPRSPANAQINVEGCSCSRPSVVGGGREQLSVYYCTCPAMQCVITATTAGASVPPELTQTCANR